MSARKVEPQSNTVQEGLLAYLIGHNCKGSVVSIRHLPELKEFIERQVKAGLFDEQFYRERLGWFDFEVPKDLPQAKSIIVMATPRPSTQVLFTWQGKNREFILPPTYAQYDKTTRRVKQLVSDFLNRHGYRASSTALPLKLLAVRSGLADYGRNNITYVQGMGSFLQLVAVYSDMPCREDDWRLPQMMKRCESCQACRANCPTGAISGDRFLLHAEKCIVFHNEKKGDIPFPSWLDPSWHNCLLGCLHCQKVCPENHSVIDWVEKGAEFTKEETILLMRGTRSRLPSETMKKWERLELNEDIDRLPRNLGVLFRK